MDSVFYFILNMSLSASVVIAALMLVRLIKPLPKRIVYPLWGLAFIRLMIPFALSTPWSLFNFTGSLVKRLVTVETVIQGNAPASGLEKWSLMNMIGAAQSYVPFEYKTESFKRFFTISTAVWAVIAAAALLTVCALYMLTMAELKKAEPVKDNIYCSGMLLSPVLAGIFGSRIILPEGLDPDSPEGRMVLAHENVHRKRLDNLWRVIAISIACIHWFNPFVWLMVRMFFADMELSCDERVLAEGKYGIEERKAYARTLLSFSEDKRFLISTAFGQSGVKVRIINVLNYRRLTAIGAFASAIFLFVLVLLLLTNPGFGG
jgi:beta-lactamase regulating signal transducer with metallopeptidase domain